MKFLISFAPGFAHRVRMDIKQGFLTTLAAFGLLAATASAAEKPVLLDVEVPSGDLEILYGRDGRVSISGFAKASADAKLDGNFFSAVLTIEQNGNRVAPFGIRRRLGGPFFRSVEDIVVNQGRRVDQFDYGGQFYRSGI